jgi:peptidoglycan-associated lipoprotein
MKRSMQSGARVIPVVGAAIAMGMLACASTPEDEAPSEVPTGSEFSQGPVVEDPNSANANTNVVLDLATVYFDFDAATIRSDARPVLKANSDMILGADSVVTIEGHTDPRGSEEYNLALGERRAVSVSKYLQNLGVPNSRLRVLSYGEAKRAADGNDESAWRWDRRAEFRTGQ